MKPSEFQKILLDDMTETQPWEHECCNGPEKRSLEVMHRNGWVYSVTYENGLHWHLTDSGSEIAGEE